MLPFLVSIKAQFLKIFLLFIIQGFFLSYNGFILKISLYLSVFEELCFSVFKVHPFNKLLLRKSSNTISQQ